MSLLQTELFASFTMAYQWSPTDLIQYLCTVLLSVKYLEKYLYRQDALSDT